MGPNFDRTMDVLEQAIETAESENLPDKVIAGMLAFLTGSSFSGDPKDIHETIYAMKKKFPKLLNMFAFAKGPAHWFSLKLESTLNHLRLCQIIIMDSDFETYRVSEKTREYLEKVLSEFGIEDKEALKQMAGMFEEKCGVR